MPSRLTYVLRVTLFFALLSPLWGCSPPPPSNESPAETSVNIDGGNGGLTDSGTQPENPLQDKEPTQRNIRASGPNKALNPGEMGPYAVGVTTLKLTDTTRKDEKGTPRPVTVEVWYPAVDEAKNTPTDEYNVEKDAPPAVKAKIRALQINIPSMKQKAHRDAAPLRKEGPYPLILFSHGSGGIRFQSVFQTAHLASHGYVVVSADHFGNTLYDLFLDKDAQNTKTLFKAAIDRPLDVKFMFEEIRRRNQDKKDRFYQMIQVKQIGTTGHSFGGMTSILVTKEIEGIRVVIPQTPHTSLLEVLGVKPVHVKDKVVMVMGAKKDNTLSYEKEEKAFYDKAVTPEWHGAARYLVTLERGGHFSYSNICELDLKKFAERLGFGNVENILSDGCAPHNTPIQEAHRIINHYATALFNVVLRKSKPSAKYLAPMKESKEVIYQYTPPVPE